MSTLSKRDDSGAHKHPPPPKKRKQKLIPSIRKEGVVQLSQEERRCSVGKCGASYTWTWFLGGVHLILFPPVGVEGNQSLRKICRFSPGVLTKRKNLFSARTRGTDHKSNLPMPMAGIC